MKLITGKMDEIFYAWYNNILEHTSVFIIFRLKYFIEKEPTSLSFMIQIVGSSEYWSIGIILLINISLVYIASYDYSNSIIGYRA